MSKVIRIEEETYELIKDTAEQLNTTIKEVVSMILDWFFSTKGGFDEPDLEEEGS